MPAYTLTLIDRRQWSNSAFVLTFRRPLEFDYVPGQRIRLVHHDVSRDYSLITTPRDPELAIYLRRIRTGILTPLLADLPCGAELHASGPLGYFNWHASSRPAVWVATGTGIAPFVAFARAGARPLAILHGATRLEEIHFHNELSACTATYVPCLSAPRPATGSGLKIFQGRVTAYLAKHLPRAVYDFYLCGRGDMIREATLLVDQHFPGSRVFSETFY
jgi:ferredoxin-NADP reductase